jgi:hypothetical protein
MAASWTALAVFGASPGACFPAPIAGAGAALSAALLGPPATLRVAGSFCSRDPWVARLRLLAAASRPPRAFLRFAVFACCKWLLRVTPVTAMPCSVRSSAIALQSYPFECIPRMSGISARIASPFATSFATHSGVLRMALRACSITLVGTLLVDTVKISPPLERPSRITLRSLTSLALMVNVISQTRSEYGGQDKDVVLVGF